MITKPRIRDPMKCIGDMSSEFSPHKLYNIQYRKKIRLIQYRKLHNEGNDDETNLALVEDKKKYCLYILTTYIAHTHFTCFTIAPRHYNSF